VEITDEDGEVVAEVAEGIGVATNNVAEYTAAIRGLERARELGATRVLLRSDSRLLIEQLAGRWKVKNATLQVLHHEARSLIKGFEEVRFEHVRRERNVQADALANRGVDEWLAGEGASWERAPPSPRLWEPEEEPR
jgi:ribonuclease HI